MIEPGSQEAGTLRKLAQHYGGDVPGCQAAVEYMGRRILHVPFAEALRRIQAAVANRHNGDPERLVAHFDETMRRL